ncbi:hypothetical protein EDD21DRAFT_119494 [Dissophora ornata]|nr:hypothetical protein EDD21DRAFT_119494 [Dissophora ornata]
MSTVSPERVGTGVAGSPFPTQLGNEWPAESSSAAVPRAAEALVDKCAGTPTLDMDMDKDNLEDTPNTPTGTREPELIGIPPTAGEAMEHKSHLLQKAAIQQYSEIMTELIAEPKEPLLETHTGEGPVRQREMDVLNAASMLNSVVITEGTKRNYLPYLKDWKVLLHQRI